MNHPDGMPLPTPPVTTLNIEQRLEYVSLYHNVSLERQLTDEELRYYISLIAATRVDAMRSKRSTGATRIKKNAPKPTDDDL